MGTILLTAILTALFTLGLLSTTAYFAYRNYFAEQLDRMLEEKLAEVGELVESRVRDGVIEGVNQVTSPEFMRRTMEKGQDSFINTMFGRPPKG